MSLQLDFQVNVFACVWIFASNLFGLSVSQISNRTNWRSFNLGSIHNISAIGVSVSNSYVWALDALGKAHIKYENGNQWAHLNDVDGTSLKLISVGEAGVWGVTKFYREIVYRYGITRILPEGNSWRKIEGQGFRQVESGPGIVYGIAQDGSLFYLVDFSPEFPHDATWRWIYGKYKYISAGMYGVWAIGADSKVYFSRITNNKPSKISKWIFVPSSVTFKKIVAGFGSTVLGLTIDGELYQMSNVNIVQPQGTNGWNRVSKLKFTDVTAGLPGIFGITVGGRTVMRQDRRCGGLLTDATGSLATPDHPKLYPANIHCLWLIHIPKAKRIYVEFEEFDLEQSEDCVKDFVAYTEDGQLSANSVLRFACTHEPWEYEFPSGRIFLEFSSDSNGTAQGFRANYATNVRSQIEGLTATTKATPTTRPTTKPSTPFSSGCGGSLNTPSGAFTSPNYPDKYPVRQDCIWLITVDPRNRIRLEFDTFEIETDRNCQFDFLAIGNGNTVNLSPIGSRKCGTSKPGALTSTGNQIWIKFRSDSSSTYKGFLARWKSIEPEIQTTKPRVVTTPPLRPTTARDFIPEGWSAISDPSVTFTQLDSGISEDLWTLDSSERAHVQNNDIWTLVGSDRLYYVSAGDSGVWAVNRDGRVIFREGITPSRPQGTRWKDLGNERFIQVDSGPYSTVLAIRRNNELVFRNGINTLNPAGRSWIGLGRRFSHVSAGSYGIWAVDGNADAYFAVRPSDLRSSGLSWNRIPGPKMRRIEAGYNGKVFALGVDGNMYQRTALNLYQPDGAKWNPIGTGLRTLTIGQDRLLGISSNGRIVKKDERQCGGILKQREGTIVSPGFPFGYPQPITCLWIIRVPSAIRISLKADSFDIYSTENCIKDHVTLFNKGYYSPGDGTTRYCGKVFNQKVFDGSEVWVEFSTNEVRPAPGFSLAYRAEFEAPTGRPAITRPVSTVFSTRERVAPETSTQHLISPTLRTTHGVPNGLYSACGGSLTGNYGTFSSPGYPNSYQNNLMCTYSIRVDPGKTVNLIFNDFQLEEDITCRFDFISIRDYDSSNAGRDLGKYCGTRVPAQVKSSGNELWVLFKSDGSVGKRGFRAVWNAIDSSGATAVASTTSTTASKVAGQKTDPLTLEPEATPTRAPVVPQDWMELPFTERPMLIESGITPNVWALDTSGKPYLLDENSWRPVGNRRLKYITAGESGVWAVDNNDKILYREAVAPLAPTGAYWTEIPSEKLSKIDSGPSGIVLAINDESNLIIRQGISGNNPKGNGWQTIGTGYKNVSAGSYGIWALDSSNNVYFSPRTEIGPGIANLRWVPVGGKFAQIQAGFDGSVWALKDNGDVYRRESINAITPTGVSWKKVDGLKLSHVTTGLSGVYGIQKRIDKILKTEDRKCGGVLTSPSGSFGSPNNPLNYPPQLTCLWVIKIPNARNIRVTFDSFDIEPSSRCTKDYLLSLKDGKFPSSFGVRRNCGRSIQPLAFEGDRAWIEFVSDANNNYPGFQARYEAVTFVPTTQEPQTTEPTDERTTTEKPTTTPLHTECGKVYTASSGSFAHASYPRKYANSQQCTYTIRVHAGQIIKLDFDLFDLERSTSCIYDYIDVRDGSSASAPQLGKICGKLESPSFQSTGNSVFVKFQTDRSTQGRGFLARWKAHPSSSVSPTRLPEGPSAPAPISECGGSLSGRRGQFANPGYLTQYDNNRNCAWILRVTPGKVVQLNFEVFDFERDPSCRYDYVEIFDGRYESDRKLGRFCNKDPSPITSSGNEMRIQFRTNERNTRRGFVANWMETDVIPITLSVVTTQRTTSSQACLQRDSGSSGITYHREYPRSYTANTDCVWILTVPQGKVIELSFPFFDLESGYPVCQKDSLTILDGSSESAESLGRFCGSRTPETLTSTGNSLFVRFKTDSEINGRGFYLRWTAKDPVRTEATTERPTENLTTRKSPSQIYSDCGGRLSSSSGSLANPGYPNAYRNNENCVWVITVPQGIRVRLSFRRFELEPYAGCGYDFLQIFDGPDSRHPEIAKACTQSPGVVTSTSNSLWIRLKTDSSTTRSGFLADWTAINGEPTTTPRPTTTQPPVPSYVSVCARRSSGTSGVIASPRFPNNYPRNTNCEHVIQTDPGKRIMIRFTDFTLEPDRLGCSNDVLTVQDGNSYRSPLLQTLCGYNLPSLIRSSGSKVFLRFRTNARNEFKGFRLEWWTEPIPLTTSPVITTTDSVAPQITTTAVYPTDVPQCGGRKFGNSGTIRSPTMNKQYPFNVTCIWVIEVGTTSTIDLYFQRFDDNNEDCSSSYLLMRDGMSSDANQLAKFCREKRPATTMRSNGNTLYIEYRAGINFQLYWRESVKEKEAGFECGGMITGGSGTISSPRYPSNYPDNSLCTWIILAPPGQRISLRFESFDLEDYVDCQYDYLQLKNGGSSSSPAIGKYCGRTNPPSVVSSSNSIWLEMKTDCKTSQSGFRLSWQVVTAQGPDGGRLTTEAAKTTSPVQTKTSTTQKTYEPITREPPTREPPTREPSTREPLTREPLTREPPRPTTTIPLPGTGPDGGRLTTEAAKTTSPVQTKPSTTQKTDEPITREPPTRQPPTREPSTREPLTREPLTREPPRPTTTIPLPGTADSDGGLVTGTNGIIQSPNFPQNYPNNKYITWVIRGPKQGKIRLEFQNLDLEADSGCRYDFVWLRDGETANSPTVGRYCGTELPAPYTSSTNSLWVLFRSDQSTTKTGFKAVWGWIPVDNTVNGGLEPTKVQTLHPLHTTPAKPGVCGGTLTSPTGIIMSPLYPSLYPSNSDCTWIIKPPSAKDISLTFEAFDLEADANCGYDSVKVMDGTSNMANVLGRFCGQSRPPTIQSDKGVLSVRFVSDDSTNKPGFMASYRTLSYTNPNARSRRSAALSNGPHPNECGGHLDGKKGILKLPKFSPSNSHPLSCKWTIKVPHGSQVELHVRSLGFGKQMNCDRNYFEVKRHKRFDLKSVSKLCPSAGAALDKELVIQSASKHVTIWYISEKIPAKDSFRVIWRARRKGTV